MSGLHRMDQNPVGWIMQVNGFVVDARSLIGETREEVSRKRLIPYIPERPKLLNDDDS